MRYAAILTLLAGLTCQAQSSRISADQKWVASSEHDRLTISSVSGAESSRPFGSEPIYGWQLLWSPSDDALAVVERNDVYLLSERDHWFPRKVFDGGESASPLGLLFSPDGKRLAISLRVSGVDGLDRGTVKIANLRDGQVKDLLTLPDGIIFHSWTPDGTRILFWSDPDFSESLVADGAALYTATVPDGTMRPLEVRTLPHADLSEYSPDGKFLALTEGIGKETWTQKRISLLDLSSGTKTFLTPENAAALFPSWSPAGELIAFAAGPDEVATTREGPDAKLGQVHIWVMKPDGSELRQLTFDPAYRDERPRWSGSGNTIVFCRVNAAGEGSVWRIDAAGSAPERIGRSFPLEYGMFGFYGYTDSSQSAQAYRKK